MKTEDLKYVVGEAVRNEPAYMHFYGRVDEYSANNFNSEFLWLQDYIKPSKIVISINSEGGSVLHGMGVYSIILNSPIETETIIEGLAASIASVIWAAGTRSYMRDYSVLMIHNPFLSKKKDGEDKCGKKAECDADEEQMIEAFRKQIETVYRKRFGLSKDKVKAIMDGSEGCDGTYFDAKQAVDAGIIPADNVLKTSKQVCTKVKNQIEGLVEAHQIQEIMASITTELDGLKPNDSPGSIPNQNNVTNSNSKTMKEQEQEFAFGSVCAQLGLDKASEVSDVVTRITALQNAEAKVTELQASLDAMKIQKEGLDAQLTQAKDELNTVKNELQTYKDAEKAQRDAEITQFIEAAIADGKIGEDAKSKWLEMAATNFDMVKDTLNSIEARKKLSEEIANDPANVENAANGLTEAEKRMNEAVAEVVGKDFQFQTLD